VALAQKRLKSADRSPRPIIFRDIGLPAMTNVHPVTPEMKTGDRLVLRADIGVVETAQEIHK
jgi:hypothetical protein